MALTRDATGAILLANSDTILRLDGADAQPIPGGEQFESIRRIRQGRSGDLLVLARLRGAGGTPRLYALAADGTPSLLAGSGESGCGTTISDAEGSRFGLPLWDPETDFHASAAELRLTEPSDIAVGPDGDIYLADAGCHVVYWHRAARQSM